MFFAGTGEPKSAETGEILINFFYLSLTIDTSKPSFLRVMGVGADKAGCSNG